MRRARRTAVPALLAFVSLLSALLTALVPTPVAAATTTTNGPTTTGPTGRIEDIDADRPGDLTVTFSAEAGGRAVPLAPDSLRATVVGRGTELVPVSTPQATTGGTTGATTGPQPSVVLALDTSGSMVDERRGIDRMGPMKAAARQFLDQLDDRVQVGLVTFGDPARALAEVGTPRRDLLRIIDGLRPDGDTALFSAAQISARLLAGVKGSRSILMLTDGENDAPRSPGVDAAAVVGRLVADRQSPIRFTALLIDSSSPDPERIAAGLDRRFPGRGLGSVATATDRGLAALLRRTFTATRENLELQQVGVFTVPPALGEVEADVLITATTLDGRPVRDRQRVVFGAARAAPATQVTTDVGSTVGRGGMLLGLAALFLALVTLLAVATGAVSGPGEPGLQVLRRLEVYSVNGPQPDRVAVQEQTITTRLGDNALTRSAVTLMTHLARRSRLDSALDGRLEAAGLPLRTAEWMLLHVGAGVGGGLLFLALGAGRAAPTLLGLTIGLAAPWGFLVLARARRRGRFLGQLPDTLQLLAGSLAAGYSLPQAMDAVVRESPAPIQDEFNRALIETRLGMPPEDALDGIGRRTASADFSWIVMAIRIQRDVGGNLAELLTTVAGTLRERERLRRQVSALSAEGRLSGVILAALPVVFTGYLMLSRPEYLAPLFGTPLGLALLATGTALLGVGAVWMAKVVKVDV